MPKLKAALFSHQAEAQRIAAVKQREQHVTAKAQSVKASSSGLKKAKKRARLAERTGQTAKVVDDTIPVSGPSEVIEDERRVDKGKAKATIPFSADDTILLLGEANFSFALSLISHHRHPAHQILATSYDSEKVCLQKYPDAQGNLDELKEAGVGVEFGVDGGMLEKCKKVGKGRWSRVIMNFPHTGSGIKDQDRNIRDNQLLLLRIFRSVKPVLTEGPERLLPGSHSGKPLPKKRKQADEDEEEEEDPAGEVTDEEGSEVEDHPSYAPESSTFAPPKKPGTILITLLDQAPYSLWSLRTLATRPPHVCPGTKLPQPKYRLLRSFRFDPSTYPGYAHRRTLGFKEGVSTDGNEEIVGRKGEARTWEFAPFR